MAPLLPGLDEASLGQGAQMKGQGGDRKPQGGGDLPRHAARRPALHQQAEERQAAFLGQGGQGMNGLLGTHFHAS